MKHFLGTCGIPKRLEIGTLRRRRLKEEDGKKELDGGGSKEGGREGS